MNTFYLIDIIRKILSIIIFPVSCVVCGKKSGVIPLCDSCIVKTKNTFLIQNRCDICGRPLISEKGICMGCRREKPFFYIKKVYPLFSYQGWGRDVLFAWKSNGIRTFSPFLAEILALFLQNVFPNIAVVPVPPRPGKIREKGWDQIEDLVSFLEKKYNISVFRILSRNVHMQQKKLNRSQRFENLKQAFCIKSLKKYKTLPQTIVIIDDIITTGATLDACAGILMENGVSQVFGLTLFYD